MQEIELNYFDKFHKLVNTKPHGQWAFRGQSNDSWPLISSFQRAADNAASIIQSAGGSKLRKPLEEIEARMIETFKANASSYLGMVPDHKDKLSWLSCMQHFGAPTRLLDFSFSPYVALYFALSSGNSDSAVYAINLKNIPRAKNSPPNPSSEEQELFVFEPKHSNHRLLNQQGLFIASNYLDITHEELLQNGKVEYQCEKIVIPAKMRLVALKRLNQMNINSSQLFPGAEGFCTSLKERYFLDEDNLEILGYEL